MRSFWFRTKDSGMCHLAKIGQSKYRSVTDATFFCFDFASLLLTLFKQTLTIVKCDLPNADHCSCLQSICLSPPVIKLSTKTDSSNCLLPELCCFQVPQQEPNQNALEYYFSQRPLSSGFLSVLTRIKELQQRILRIRHIFLFELTPLSALFISSFDLVNSSFCDFKLKFVQNGPQLHLVRIVNQHNTLLLEPSWFKKRFN